LHLRRLDAASRELFGVGLDGERVREYVRSALDGDLDASVRVDARSLSAGEVSVMVTVRAPIAAPERPQRLQTVAYERPMAHLKHVGTFSLIHHGESAERAGYDDALLMRADGTVLETTTANIAVVKERTLVWPEGPILHGIAQQLIEADLPTSGLTGTRRPLRLADLRAADSVVLSNSLGVVSVCSIDDAAVASDPAAFAAVGAIYDSVAWDQI
jgi:branched-subunit amino acid aminotransferase/4-amino-4-deoxychorismate lyase